MKCHSLQMADKDKTGICALHHCPAVLVDSHVIPKMLHKRIGDDKKRALQISLSGVSVSQNGNVTVKPLLSREADNWLGSTYESPMEKWFASQKEGPFQLGEMTQKAIPYTTFKLFFLSILWRASLVWNMGLTLGVREALRQMILTQDPGGPFEFPFVVNLVLNTDGTLHKNIVVPPRVLYAGNTEGLFPLVWMSFAGYDTLFMVTRKRAALPEKAVALFPQLEGTISVEAIHESVSAELAHKVHFTNHGIHPVEWERVKARFTSLGKGAGNIFLP